MSNSEIITEIPEEEKQAFGKILKAYMDYKARGWAKNKLNGQKVLKKYQNIQQATTVLPQSVKGIDYTSSAKTLKPSSGGLFTDRERIKDVILQEMKEDQIKAENEAKEEIKNKLLAYNDRKRFLQELKLQEEIPTKQDEKKIVRDVFTQAFLGLRDKLKAKQILRTKKLIKKMENEKPLSSISTSQDQQRLKNIYASVVEDATNSALARLVELDGKQYVAQHLAIESPKVVLKKSTLAQKLGLEERNIPSNNLFSSPNNRNENDIMSSRASLNKKIDQLYKENLAKRVFGAYKTKTEDRYSNMENSYNALTAKPGRLVKGSQEAKDYMASIRAMRTGLPRRTKAQIESDNIILAERKAKPGRLVKGSQEAKDHMAALRSKRVLKTWDPTKRALKPGTVYNNLVAFGPMKAPKKTPKPRAKTWDPTKRALKPGTVYKNLVAFGPMKAPKKTPKPRVKKSPPAPVRDAATVAALIARANFLPRSKPRGRPRKDAKVFFGY